MGTHHFSACTDLVEHIVRSVGNNIVLGIPLGMGKPNQLVNALYKKVAADPSLHLTILSALSLEKPRGASDLEQRFLGPLVERVFGDYPDLEYVRARREQRLPPNVRVIEFFLKTGDYLDNTQAQQDFICTNYTNAARDMVAQGVNVLAQAVAVEEGVALSDLQHVSLSCNPDTTADMLDLLAAQQRRVLTVACINRKLPYLENDALLDLARFDCLLSDPASTHDLFAPPNMKVSLVDYAIGLYASSLVKDGGTLQIGIGSLGDAIAHGLLLRQQQNQQYRQVLHSLGRYEMSPPCQDGEFAQGLYGCSEMFVNGFLHLIQQGVVQREVFSDLRVQTLLNQGRLHPELRADTLQVLRAAGLLSEQFCAADLRWLQENGFCKQEARIEDGHIKIGAQAFALADWEQAAPAILNPKLEGGIFMHGGFFLGPRAFYRALREMPVPQRKKISMRRISRINSLSGHEELARAQRRDACFINTTMQVSLLGAASSDSLGDGRVVSGVGGQYNFVAMADALPDARSILMLRSTHSKHDHVWSSIVWSLGQTTIPRHLRDIVITEYGIADLRAQTDGECVRRLLAVSDARFQDELLEAAKKAGKIAADFEIPPSWRENTPALLEARLRTWRKAGLLPDFPFGSDFTEDEIVIVKALKKLKAAQGHPLELLHGFLHSFGEDGEDTARYLQRMDMEQLDSIKLRLLRRLFVGNLS